MPGVVGRILRAMGLAVSLIALATETGEASPGAGTVISNAVSAQYHEPAGLTYATQSNTISVSVASVSGIVVSAKGAAVDPASEGFPVGTPITRTVTILNAVLALLLVFSQVKSREIGFIGLLGLPYLAGTSGAAILAAQAGVPGKFSVGVLGLFALVIAVGFNALDDYCLRSPLSSYC